MSRLRYIPRTDYTYRSSEGISKSSRGGLEFAGIRRYVPGDDVRRIAWRASARAPYLLIKEYEDEVDFCLKILIDVSRSMTEYFPDEVSLREFVKKFWLPATKQGINVAIHPFASKIYPACLLSELSIAAEISNFRFEEISRTLNFEQTMLLIISDFRSEEPGNSLELLQSFADHCDLIALKLNSNSDDAHPYAELHTEIDPDLNTPSALLYTERNLKAYKSKNRRHKTLQRIVQKLIFPPNIRYSSFSAEHNRTLLYQERHQELNLPFLLESPREFAVQSLTRFFKNRLKSRGKLAGAARIGLKNNDQSLKKY